MQRTQQAVSRVSSSRRHNRSLFLSIASKAKDDYLDDLQVAYGGPGKDYGVFGGYPYNGGITSGQPYDSSTYVNSWFDG